MSAARVLFYVQHLQGVGHLYRAARIARAMTAAGLAVDLVSGGRPVPGLNAGGAALRQLAPVQCPDGDFANLRDGRGNPIDEAFKDRRREALLALFRESAPDAVIIEAFPFGRRQMGFELLAFLEAAASRDPKPVVVCSVRDILQANKKPQRIRETVDRVNGFFDFILVHGDPAFAALEETFPAAGEFAAKVHYTGMVADPDPAGEPEAGVFGDRAGGEVLVSAGGGATDSGALLRAALAARPLSSLKDRPWRLLAGPNLAGDERARLVAAAPEGVTVESNRDDFPALLSRCAVSVSQAGYNTVAELLRAGCRAVVAPYSAGGETEQSLRAARLHEKGLAHAVEEAALNPKTLAAAVDAAAGGPRPDRSGIDLGGAENSARLVKDWLGK
ncbi:MAG: glycosyl transferase [Rhodospirillaceae bacterium]|mgnify:CR=1 FL=1|jgi:predicted glycosyltransferase|nr:glycosyl transferase [Rhodospirillaceae bacterium]|tara:strand:- start:6268 stop:7434 length:1167 start_codon:yes stop_codon:yes gene_type:complete